MNQHIGLSYAVSGQEQIINAFAQIFRAGTHAINKLDAMQIKLQSVASGLTQLIGPVQNVARIFGEMNGTAAAAKTQVGGLAASMGALKREASGFKMPKIVMPQMASMGGDARDSAMPVGGRAAAQGLFGSLGAAGFMMRYQAYMAAARAAKFGLVDVGMGRTRVGIDEALGELSAVGFDKIQKNQTEIAGRKYSERFPNVTTEEYVKGMSQTASAFDVNRLGVTTLERLNEAALMMGKLGKMNPEAAGEFQSKLLNQYLAAQDKATYRAITEGGKANVRGFGNVDLAGMSEKMMAMVAKSMEISNIWGKGAMDFMSYAGPIMSQNKWDPSTMLAFAGTLVDAGFKGAKSGRAMQDLFLRMPENFAKLEMLQAGTLKQGAKGVYKEMQEAEAKARAARVRKLMTDDKKFIPYMQQLMPQAMALAQKAGQDPKYSTSLVKDFGFSKYFLPQIMAMSSEGFFERLINQSQQIKGADFSGLQKKVEESVDSVGMGWKKLVNQSDRLWQAMANGSGVMGTFTSKLAGAAGWLASHFEEGNKTDLMKQRIDQWQKAGMDKQGNVKDISAVKSLPEIKDEINKWMGLQWREGLRLIPKPGQDASQFEKDEYKEKRQELFDRIHKGGKDLYYHARTKGGMFANPDGQTQEDVTIAQEKLRVQNLFNSAVEKTSGVLSDAVQWMERFRQGLVNAKLAPDHSQSKSQFSVGAGQGGGSAPTQVNPTINVRIGNKEIKDVVAEVVAETTERNHLEHRTPWGARFVR